MALTMIKNIEIFHILAIWKVNYNNIVNNLYNKGDIETWVMK